MLPRLPKSQIANRKSKIFAGLLHLPLVYPPFEGFQPEEWEACGGDVGQAGEFYGLEILVVHDFHGADNRAIGKIHHDNEFFAVVEPHKRDEVGFVGVAQPNHAAVAEGGVRFTELDQVAIDVAQRGSIFGVPKDGHFFEQRRVAGLGRIAYFHAVVEERDTVEAEHEGRGSQGAADAEAGDSASLVVIIGNAHVQRVARELPDGLIPGAFQFGRRSAVEQDIVERAVERPGVIDLEGLEQQVGLACLGQHDDIGLQLAQFGARLFPERGRDHGGDVAAETIEIEGRGVDPMLEHRDHVLAELRVFVVESGDVGPCGHRRDDFAGGVLLVKLGMLHHDAIPGGVIGDNVDDDLEAALVGGGDKALEVGLGAVIGVDGVVVADRVGAADRALAELLAEGMNGHQPNDVDAEVFQFVQPRGNAIEIAFGGKIPWEKFVNDAVAEPGRCRTRGLGGEVIGRVEWAAAHAKEEGHEKARKGAKRGSTRRTQRTQRRRAGFFHRLSQRWGIKEWPAVKRKSEIGKSKPSRAYAQN